MSEIWKKRLRKILFWISGAVCGAGGAFGVQKPVEQAACAVNAISAPESTSSAPPVVDAIKGLFK